MGVWGTTQRVALIFAASRIEQLRVIHRFLPRLVGFKSLEEMDTTAGEATSVHHRREVHEAFVGELTGVGPHISSRSVPPPALSRTRQPQVCLRWACTVATEENSRIPGRCRGQSALAACLHGAAGKPNERLHHRESLHRQTDGQ